MDDTPKSKKPALKTSLLPHQQRVIDKLKNDDVFGVLAYHGLGSGKSLTSIAAANWAFRQLISMVEYKAVKANVKVKMVDPRRTSRKCSKCGHDEDSNRKNQSTFKCKECGYETNADRNASKNISAVGASLHQQGLSDTARSRPQGMGQTVTL